MRTFAWCCTLLVFASSAALAQVEAVDPDVAAGRPSAPTVDSKPTQRAPAPLPPPRAKPGKKEPAKEPKGALAAPVPTQPVAPEKPTAGAGLGNQGTALITQADFDAAWMAWKRAAASSDAAGERRQREQLLALRDRVGASNFDSWAVGLLRTADESRAALDNSIAIELALTAVKLAPDLPAAWAGLGRVYLATDLTDVGRYVSAMAKSVSCQLRDPRYLRPFIGNMGVIFLFALMMTAMGVVSVLFLRRVQYFLYDFHFLFPQAVARWQSSGLALVVLALPIVFRMGVVPVLLVLFAAVSLYLTLTERIVAAVWIALMALVPLFAGVLAEKTAFADTPAQSLYLIERGGPGIDPLVEHLERMAAEDKTDFAERFVLGRHFLRRGALGKSIEHFKVANALRPNTPSVLVNFGVALMLSGDFENSRAVLEGAARGMDDPAALFDLAILFHRRVAAFGDAVAGEIDRANGAYADAREKDPSLPTMTPADFLLPDLGGHGSVRTIPLPLRELEALAVVPHGGDLVRQQLSAILTGDTDGATAILYPLLAALLLVAFGFLGQTLEAARSCNRCGRPVSRRGDPEISAASPMCAQCINVFTRRGVVQPSQKVRKQLEIARYQNRIDRLTFALGVVWAGLGDVFAGRAIRGCVFGFLFMAALVAALLRDGVLPVPYDQVSATVRILPSVITLLVVYAVSLRGLKKQQG
jgi:tetratricopeptide (TPR) repeat protein